ncbi:MAG: sensor histidine kinase [bacterium]
MDLQSLPTEFASAERLSMQEVKKQNELIHRENPGLQFVNNTPICVVTLNRQRQIVHANKTLLKFLGIDNLDAVSGKRPGEALNCIHAIESPGGCGTTEFCSECGAVNAILAAQSGEEDIKECRIIENETGNAIDLRVWTAPIEIEDEEFTLFSFTDISDEKRRRVLERIFFHDVLNTAGGVKGISELFKDADENEIKELSELINDASTALIDEIKSQQLLTAAENNELVVSFNKINPIDLLKQIQNTYQSHQVATMRKIEIVESKSMVTFESDHTILKRVIGNMTKNALEASEPNTVVTLNYRKINENIEFSVHNHKFMPRNVQLQVFQRSFSTKGSGRGLGTYSMRLLSERYLNGKVYFKTDENKGTTFFACYPLSPPEEHK